MASTFPFAAIVGQDEMTLAIQVVAIDPAVGGVLVLGDRGTGKSTAVRALADLLPPIQVVKGCPYRCDPTQPANACPICQAPEGERAAKPVKPSKGSGRARVTNMNAPRRAAISIVGALMICSRSLASGSAHLR